MSVEYGEQWRHKGTGVIYLRLGLLRIRNKRGQWLDGVLYRSLDGAYFARTVKSFANSFEAVKP
jgi:hypothetical protein